MEETTKNDAKQKLLAQYGELQLKREYLSVQIQRINDEQNGIKMEIAQLENNHE